MAQLSLSPSESLVETLCPRGAENMSGRMIALLGHLLRKKWTEPQIQSVQVDGQAILCQRSGEVGHNHVLSRESFETNLKRWIQVCRETRGLSERDERDLRRLVQSQYGTEIAEAVL